MFPCHPFKSYKIWGCIIIGIVNVILSNSSLILSQYVFVPLMQIYLWELVLLKAIEKY